MTKIILAKIRIIILRILRFIIMMKGKITRRKRMGRETRILKNKIIL
jgi:hypothetical protein